jgi:hypothetical protein
MSRSNPTSNSPNPSERWYQWVGDKGFLRYYDKEKAENVEVALPFTFVLLDQLACVKGWHDASDSGIFSNEVRDTRQETLVVRAFKGGELASGLYAAIRDRVGNMGGHFTASLYIAFHGADKQLHVGNLQLKGSQVQAWSEFTKSNRNAIYSKAIRIKSYGEGKKGKVVYRFPVFELVPLSEQSDAKAKELDAKLQEYLVAYLARPKDQASVPTPSAEQVAEVEGSGTPTSGDAEADAITAQQAAQSEDPNDEIPF